ncbi:HD-GYP domain-containing protein [Sulfurimonas sp.]
MFNLNSFLMSVSLALDLVEKEILGTKDFHSKRVAYMALRLSQFLNLTPQESFDLVSLAIMHDNGLTEALLKSDMSQENFFQMETIHEHCIIGEKNTKNFPFLTAPTNVILYHHEAYDGSGFFGKKGDEIPFMSQIIAFVDALDTQFYLMDDCLENKKRVCEYAKQHSGTYFNPKIVDAFLKLADTTAFWLDLDTFVLVDAIKEHLEEFEVKLSWEDIFVMSNVFSKIIDSKSTFTAQHTSELIEKVETMAKFYQFDKEKILKLKIAAALHDLGKLVVPNDILEKNGALDDEEFNTIQSHTYFTHVTLKNVGVFSDIEKWAFQHHEKLDGSGYPYGLNGDELSFESRMMGCLDIYQAITEIRPYRDSLSHEKAISIMDEMVLSNKIDKNITNDINLVFGKR